LEMLKSLISIFLYLIIFIISPLNDVNAAFLYKSYVIRKDNGRDILCDSYIVQKNDWVSKLFSQRGEISQKDFPEFLSIFKRINPHIHNVDRILSDQHIFIPLKILSHGSMMGQSAGIVTIPFVTISSIPEILQNHSITYTIKKGECLSRLIVQGYHTDEATTKLYREGMKLFRLINPEIVDPDIIRVGQKVYIPNPSIRNQSWYKYLFDAFGNIVEEIVTDDKANLYARDEIEIKPSSFKQLAQALDAKLLNKGIYYFPIQGEEDFGLDTSIFPVIELKNQSRIIFQEYDIRKYALNAVMSFWKNVIIIPVSQELSSEQLFDLAINSVFKDSVKNKLSFSDQGMEVNIAARWIIETVCINFIENPDEHTPDAICRYLESRGIIVKDIIKDGKIIHHNTKAVQSCNADNNVFFIKDRERKNIVKDLLKAMGYGYEQNINITFPYKGIQVEALSNLISLKDDSPLIVDFGNIYGEAIEAIKKAGMDVIRIDTGDKINTIIEKLLKGMGLDYTTNPMLFVAKRPGKYNTSLNIPGFLVGDVDSHKILISTVPLHNELIQFLRNRDLKIIFLANPPYLLAS